MSIARFAYGQTNLFFPTPVLNYQIEDAERINAALLAEIAARRASDPGVTRSNRAGWHSEPDFFSRKEPAHAELAQGIYRATADATKRLSPLQLPDTLRMQIKGWVNVNPPAAYNVPHDHPGSFWSGCYYIKNPRPETEDRDSGAITFIDPRCAPAGQSMIQATMFRGSQSLTPAAGVLLLFPSNVKHWVHPNAADEDRVTMAFNVYLFSGPSMEDVEPAGNAAALKPAGAEKPRS